MKMMALEEAKEYTRQKLAPYYSNERIENVVKQYVSVVRPGVVLVENKNVGLMELYLQENERMVDFMKKTELMKDFKHHSHNRLYVFNTARQILADQPKRSTLERQPRDDRPALMMADQKEWRQEDVKRINTYRI